MRVLFIGNSHTYFNDMPATFAQMCEQLTGNKPEVTMFAYSNRSLKWHMEEYFSVRFSLLYGAYDYCVIQQQAHPFPDEEETTLWFRKIIELCRKSGTEPVIYMTWAAKKEPEMFPVISRYYRKLASEEQAILVPIGEYFAEAQDKFPDIDLYWEDGEHASVYGDYLVAASLAYKLTGVSGIDLLSDDARDFHVRFPAETEAPGASENTKQCRVKLDAEKAKLLRGIIR